MILYISPGHGSVNRSGVIDRGAISETGESEYGLVSSTIRPILDGHVRGFYPVPSMRLKKKCKMIMDRSHKDSETKNFVLEIHMNAAGSESAHGIEVLHKSLSEEEKHGMSDSELIKLSEEESRLKLQAKKLCEFLCYHYGLRNRGPKPDSGTRHKRLAICRDCGCDGFVVELGFITNYSDRQAVRDGGTLSFVAAVSAWKQWMEDNYG